MKFFGRKIQGPNVEYVVIPRNDGDLIFKAQAVLDYEEFNKLVSFPEAPSVMLPGGKRTPDANDPSYLARIKMYQEQQYAFLVLKSLSVTEGLEWETVVWDNPNTWPLWEKELRDSGLTRNEIGLIQVGVSTANGLNQEKLDEARNRFLASLSPVPGLTSPKDEHKNMQSGDPVSGTV